MDLRTIQIDFDVHKKIESERQSFSEQPNDVLRRLLGLAPPQHSSETAAQQNPPSSNRKPMPWLDDESNVVLPHGTKLRMTYNKRQHLGVISNGKWLVEGKEFDSPSGAAGGVALTKKGQKTKLDGWIYWEVKLPNKEEWKPISSLRPVTEVTLKDLGLD